MPQDMHLHGVCACTPLACSSTSTRGPRHRRRDQAEATLAGAMAAILELVAAGRAAAATKVANAAATKVANTAAATAMAMVSNDIRGGERRWALVLRLCTGSHARNAVSR